MLPNLNHSFNTPFRCANHQTESHSPLPLVERLQSLHNYVAQFCRISHPTQNLPIPKTFAQLLILLIYVIYIFRLDQVFLNLTIIILKWLLKISQFKTHNSTTCGPKFHSTTFDTILNNLMALTSPKWLAQTILIDQIFT